MKLAFFGIALRNFVEDMVSRGISGLPVSLLSTVFEGWVYSSDYMVWGKTRLLYFLLFPLNVLIWSFLLDKMREKYTVTKHTFFRKVLADGSAFILSVVPIYVVCATIAGANIRQIGAVVLWSAILGLFAGRINGLARDFLRKYSKLFWGAISAKPS